MNETEERLWDYIDGSCSPQERQAISRLIAEDAAWRGKYEQLLQLNAELQALELEEPPMAFTYNVMETIRTEQARQPLKAVIDKKVINGLAAFFIFTIGALVVYSLYATNWTSGHSAGYAENLPKMPSLKNYLSAPVLKGFLFFDVLLLLALFDGYLRRRKYLKQA